MFSSDYFPTYPVGSEGDGGGGGGTGGLTEAEVDAKIEAFRVASVVPIQTQVTALGTDKIARSEVQSAVFVPPGDPSTSAHQKLLLVTRDSHNTLTSNALTGFNATTVQPGLSKKVDKDAVQTSIYLPTTGTPGTAEYDDQLLLLQGQGMALVNSVGATQFAPKSLVTTVTNLDTTVQDHLANHPSGGDLTNVPTKDDVIRRVWLEIQAYHMGNTLWLPAPNRRCTGLWIISDGSRVNTFNYDGTVPHYGGDTQPLNDLVPDEDVVTPILQWREYFARQKGLVDATMITQNLFLGYTRKRIMEIMPSAYIPRGIRVHQGGKLKLTRKMGTTFTFLTTFSFNTATGAPDTIWGIRFGIGYLWWQLNGFQNNVVMEWWPGEGDAQYTNVAVEGLFPDDWMDPLVRVFGMSVDTARNKLAVLLAPKVYEWVPPPTNTPAIHTYSRGVEWQKPAHNADIIFTPHPEYTQIPQTVNWTEWRDGTFVPNPGHPTGTPGPDPTNWDPNGIKDAYLSFGALDTWEGSFRQDLNVYEVRTYDEYLPKESLVREAFHIYDTTLRRTNPPTVT